MKIGILHEGDYDVSYSVIVERIFEDEEIIFEYYNAHGPIVSVLKPAYTYFSEKTVDLVIFASDLDGSDDKRKLVVEFLKGPNLIIPIIPVFCEPHFEEWFIKEYNTIAHILPDAVDPEGSLNQHHLRGNPKDLINVLISEQSKKSKEYLLRKEIYPKISKNINLDLLSKRDSNFRTFKESLEQFQRNYKPLLGS